jgi:PAS domain S-box-containing protein
MNNKNDRASSPTELRRQAEEIAWRKAGQSSEDLEILSPEEIRQILHELRVHQIELEMQNEELRRAQVELEATRARYFDLYDLAPVGYLTLTEKGLIQEANFTAGTLLGVDRGVLSKQPLSRFILSEDQDIYYQHRNQLFETGPHQVCELRIRHANADPIWARIESFAAKDVDGAPIYRTLISDITMRKQAEEERRASESRYQSYIEVTGQLGWTTNPDGEVKEDIPSWRKFTGQSKEEVMGSGWSKAIHPDEFEYVLRVWKEAVSTKKGYETEYRVRRYDGVYRHFLARSVPVFKNGGDIREWVGTCIDITERKQAEEKIRRLNTELEQRVQERTADLVQTNEQLTIEIAERLKMEQSLLESKEQLRILASQILMAQENERKLIALEVHDSLGSSLSAIKFKAEDALQNIAKGKPMNEYRPLESIISMVKETIDNTKRIQSNLRPPLLDDLGILATFSWFCREFQKVYSNIQVEQTINLQENEIPESLKIVIFRITQEAMNNLAKHAGADWVYLGLQKIDNAIELCIKDNGGGFDPESLSTWDISKKGLGLNSMKERTKFSGGSFAIESAEGKGTVIRASWPV